MTLTNRDPVISEQLHESAIAQTLRWAQEAADSGDFSDTLQWLHAVELVRENLPQGWDLKQESWRLLRAQ